MWNKLVIKELIEKYCEIIRESWHERDHAKNGVTTQPIFILNALVLLYNLEIEHNLK